MLRIWVGLLELLSICGARSEVYLEFLEVLNARGDKFLEILRAWIAKSIGGGKVFL